MSYQNNRPVPTPVPRDPLERGRFSDGRNQFTVRASSADAPESFQVYANENRADLVLIVSGLTSGSLYATWGDEWRAFPADWREWTRDSAFRVFYNGANGSRSQTRFCNG